MNADSSVPPPPPSFTGIRQTETKQAQGGRGQTEECPRSEMADIWNGVRRTFCKQRDWVRPRQERPTLPRGAFINDVLKFLGFFDPLPPCPHLDLIYTINSRSLPSYVCFSMTPLPPSKWTSYLEARTLRESEWSASDDDDDVITVNGHSLTH